jgi:hypothetical protein
MSSALVSRATPYLAAVGAVVTVFYALQLAASLASAAASACRRRPYKKGDWAVVTGASDVRSCTRLHLLRARSRITRRHLHNAHARRASARRSRRGSPSRA